MYDSQKYKKEIDIDDDNENDSDHDENNRTPLPGIFWSSVVNQSNVYFVFGWMVMIV